MIFILMMNVIQTVERLWDEDRSPLVSEKVESGKKGEKENLTLDEKIAKFIREVELIDSPPHKGRFGVEGDEPSFSQFGV
jgi:hypothetical protein